MWSKTRGGWLVPEAKSCMQYLYKQKLHFFVQLWTVGCSGASYCNMVLVSKQTKSLYAIYWGQVHKDSCGWPSLDSCSPNPRVSRRQAQGSPLHTRHRPEANALSPFTGWIKKSCLNKSKFSSQFTPFQTCKEKQTFWVFLCPFWDSHFWTKKGSFQWIIPKMFQNNRKS